MPALVPRRFLSATALLVAPLAMGCAAPTVQNCQRYEGVSLNRENGFSTRLDWKSDRFVDLPMESIEVAVSVVPPISGPLELVHVVGDREVDHWSLSVPDVGGGLLSLCRIQDPGVQPNCGATLRNVPFSPGGYYYLRAGDNTVLEAGLAFLLCD